MTKKDYEAAATIIQENVRGPHNDTLRELVIDLFVDFFKRDNGRFDEDRFRRACVPGANVKARTR